MFARIMDEPVLLYGLIQALIATVAAFGINLTAEQTGAIMIVSSVGISLITRMFTTPNKRGTDV